jgi:hypothetical protein
LRRLWDPWNGLVAPSLRQLMSELSARFEMLGTTVTAGGKTMYPESPDLAVARHAERQFGVFALPQIHRAELCGSAISRRIAKGLWERLLPGVFRLRGAPPSWHQELWAALLWAGEGALVSHRAAGLLWGLDGMERDAVEVSIPHHWGRGAKGLTVHRSRELSSRDITRRGGFPVTTMVRTLIDLAGVLDARDLEIALESAIRKGLDLSWLARRLGQLGGKGRRGAGLLQRMVAERTERPETPDSPHEVRLLRLLRDSGLPEPEMHYDVCDGKYHVAEVDFAFVKQRVAVEATSYANHSGKKPWAKDAHRISWLAALHWRTVFVTWDDVERRPDVVIDWIRRAMGPAPQKDEREVA